VNWSVQKRFTLKRSQGCPLADAALGPPHCNTLQHTAAHCKKTVYPGMSAQQLADAILGSSHCNTLQHTATHCNTMKETCVHRHVSAVAEGCGIGLVTRKHTAAHCGTLRHTAAHCNTLQHTETHCNTLQHTATRCNTLKQTRISRDVSAAAGRCSIRPTRVERERDTAAIDSAARGRRRYAQFGSCLQRGTGAWTSLGFGSGFGALRVWGGYD